MGHVRPRRVENGLRCIPIHEDVRLAPNGHPSSAIVYLDGVYHPGIPVGIEPPPKIEHDGTGAARIDDWAGKVVKTMRCGNARIAPNDDACELVVRRWRMIQRRIGITTLVTGRRRCRANLPFRAERPAIPVIACCRRRKRLFVYRHRSGTRQRTIGARQNAVRTRCGQTCGTSTAASRIAIVHGTIAIIVETIADLGGRHYRGYTPEHTALALVCPGRTYPGQTRVARAAAAGIAFIDGPIAVVIEAVASLRRLLRILIANERTVHAGTRSCRADPELARRARRAASRIAFVRCAIAIVIEAVTHFGRWRRIAIAREHPHRTCRRACRTHAKLTRTARHAAARIVFIGRTIAIVIEAVACFRRRRRIAIAGQRASRTSRRARGTHAELPCTARHAATRIAFIGGPIAIIIEAVA